MHFPKMKLYGVLITVPAKQVKLSEWYNTEKSAKRRKFDFLADLVRCSHMDVTVLRKCLPQVPGDVSTN